MQCPMCHEVCDMSMDEYLGLVPAPEWAIIPPPPEPPQNEWQSKGFGSVPDSRQVIRLLAFSFLGAGIGMAIAAWVR